MAKERSGKNGEIYRMQSGLEHTADSLGNSKTGNFVDYFGPPGPPDSFSKITTGTGTIGNVGKVGDVATPPGGGKRK